MGLFSFGGSKSKSSGFSESRSQSRQEAVSGSVGGGFSEAGSQSASQGASTQAIAFEDVFARLFGGAEQAAASLDPSLLTQQANQLFSGGTEFLDSIGGDLGTQFMQDRLASGNPLLQEQIDFLGEDIGEFLREEVNPAIAGEAIRAGQLGGGRQGVAQGEAAEAALEQFTRGASNLRYQDVASRDALAGTLASQSLAGAQTGLGGLSELAGLAQFGFGAGLEPSRQLAAILGGPTVLTQSQQQAAGSSFSSAEDFARAFSQSLGQSSSESTSKTKSKGSGVSIGFGGS